VKNRVVLTNLIWRFAERVGAQCVAFIVSIIIARMLAPEDYGTIALIAVFTNILAVFVDSGFGNALIQKKNADDIDFSTVFYFNIVMSIALYIVMFFAAPLIAKFYMRTELIPLIRVISLLLISYGIKNIQQAYVSKHMIFKRFFFSTLAGTIGAAAIGIIMAYMGFGVWALVAQGLFNTTVDTIILWITVKWRPKRVFSFERLKELFKFSWKLLISSLLDTAYAELRQLIIGKKYTEADLAFYNKGESFPKLLVQNINASIDSVLLPTLSEEQDNTERVREMTRRAIKTSVFIMAPLMMGLAAAADNVVAVLLTDKWMECVPFMRVFCITYMFWPIHTANLNAIKAMGRSDKFLKLEIIKKMIGLVSVVITMNISVWAMCLSLLVTSVLCQIVNAWPNKKLLNYGYLSQLKDIAPSIGLTFIMASFVYALGYVELPTVAILIMQISLGAVIYVLGAKLLRMDSYTYVMDMIKTYFKKPSKRG